MTPTETLEHLRGDGRFFGACVIGGPEHVILGDPGTDGGERVTVTIGRQELAVAADSFLDQFTGATFRAANAGDVA